MKKTYSDPLIFANILLTESTISVGVSEGESTSPNDAIANTGLVAGSSALSITSGTTDATVSANNADVQIADSEQKSEPTVTEESIQSIIDQIMGEDTEAIPSDESSLAD